MFLGHFAVGLALKSKNRQTSLGTLFAAVQWPDLIWPIFLLLGWESVLIVPASNPLLNFHFVSYPYSHSLAAVLLWAALFALVYRWRTGRGAAALWLGFAVVSHWVLDWIAHVPDLPLAPGLADRVGLGLWRVEPAAVALELVMFAGGLWIYARATRARDRIGSYGFWSLAGLLGVFYLGSLAGPPPPTVRALAFSALAMWPLLLWAAWADRHREPRAQTQVHAGATAP